MELLKGMIRDTHPSKAPGGSWRDAMNMVVSRKFRDASNEEGFRRVENIYGGVVGRIEISDRLVLFIVLPMGDAKISILEADGSLTDVIIDPALNFSTSRPIEGVFTYNFKRELIIAWWETLADDANPPRLLNIDCLPFELNPDKSMVNPSEIYLAKMFPDTGGASIDLVKVNNTGGNLESGVYQFLYAYQLSDNSITNYSGITNWIPVIDEDTNRDFIEIDGCPSGTATNKSITVELTNLDVNYPNVVIAVIKKIGGVISAVKSVPIPVNSSTLAFTYVSDDGMYDEAVGNIIVPTVSYSHIKTGDVLGNRLYIANLKTIPEFDFQPYANNIKLKWDRATAVNLATLTNSYKDPVFVVDKRSFLSGEVYAFYIIFKMKDGTYSSAYHIPGRAVENMVVYGNLPENSLVSDMVTAGFPPPDPTEFIAIDAAVRFHEVFPTAKSTGELGVFENQNETYPDNDCWDIKDALGVVTGTLRNTNIRHHRMPSIDQLASWASPFYTPSTGVAFDSLVAAVDNGWGGNNSLDFTTSSINALYLTATATVDKYELTAVVDFIGYLSVSMTVYAPTNDMQFVVKKISTTGAETVLGSHNVNGFLFADDDDFSYFGYVSLDLGDRITVECLIVGTPVVIRPTVTATIGMRFDYFAGSDGSSEVIAITANDVNIPADIQAKIDGYYLCYAVRDQNNSLKVANGLMPNSLYDGTKKEFYIESFDLAHTRPPIAPAFVRTQHYFSGLSGGYLNLVFESLTADVVNRQIDESFYLPANVTVPIKNIADLTYYTKLVNAFNYTNGRIYFSEVFNYYKDVYKDFTSQRLVIIPTLQAKTTINTGLIYGGDTFIQPVGHYSEAKSVSNPVSWLTVCETNANVGYRHDDEIKELKYIPKSSPAYNADPYFGDYIGYNDDYTSLNNTILLVVYRCTNACSTKISDFPFRIHRSLVIGDEAEDISWRKFMTNEYREMRARDKGEIWSIKAFNKAMIIYQKYSMFIAQFRDVLYSDDVETYLGVGDIFARDPDELLPDGRGYAGNQSQYCTFLCKHGLVSVDLEQGKVFLFNGKLEELSAKGNRTWFDEFFRKNSELDNPYLGFGCHGTFIEKSNRIVLTKNGVDGQTVSFSFDLGAWISRHSYKGNMYAYNRTGSFIYADNYLYKMEDWLVGYYSNLVGADQKRDESWIDVVFAEPQDMQKVFQAVVWDTKVFDPVPTSREPIYLYDRTINRICVYNDSQISGEVALVNGKNLVSITNNERNVEYNWKFNDFRDCIISRNAAILNDDGSFYTANINNAKVWFNKSKFISKFIVVRMIMDNVERHIVLISNVNVNAKKSER